MQPAPARPAITITKKTGETLTLHRPGWKHALPFAAWLGAAGVASVTNWGYYWIAWITAGFLVPELYAVLAHVKLGPLSDNYWRWEGLNYAHPFDLALWSPVHWILAVIVWLLFAWLSVHLPFRAGPLSPGPWGWH